MTYRFSFDITPTDRAGELEHARRSMNVIDAK